ncbi:mannosyl-oligosaccharide alpha-1,2-mannosidase, partial [Kappamyces sp. JEL0680]
ASHNPRRAAFEKREQENRRRQENRQDIIKELQQDSLLMNTIASDVRVDRKRRLKHLGIQEIEQETLKNHLENLQKEQKIKEDLQREEELVREMQAYHQQQLKEQKLRQSIKETSVELRELEQKLNYAYMNKERSLQLQEKKLLVEKSILEDNALYGNWKAQAAKAELDEVETQKRNQEKAAEYQKSLHRQVEENRQKEKEEYQQFLKEKAMVDEIVKKINHENEREARLRLEKQQETKAFVEQFMKERQEWMEEERQRQEEENQKIEAYAKLQANREENAEAKKKLLAADKDAIYDKLASEIQNKEKMKAELEDLRIDLAQEEQEAQARKREEDLLQSRIRKRLETIDAYQAQVADKKARQLEEKKEEEAFREKLMQKFAEDDRIEQMKQTTRRLKQLEHRRAVDALVEERKRILAQEEQEQLRKEAFDVEMARYKAAVIEQERQRLLREHASKLAGFLPKVLRGRS